MNSSSTFGATAGRREDPKLLTGNAEYTADIDESKVVHAAIVRSQYAHAELTGIDISRAENHDDVIAAFTAEDVAESGVPGHLPLGLEMPGLVNPGRPMMAREKTRYQGEPVAVVVATNQYSAHDAADLVDVDYRRLDAETDPVAATDDAPTIHEEAPNNVAVDWETGDEERTDEAFAAADHVVSLDVRNQRLLPTAMEPRAALAAYDDIEGKLTVTMSTQTPHRNRDMLAETLGVPSNKVRVVAPDVGGGFGSKGHHYPDQAITAWCSMQLGRPVKWVARRRESFLADTHGRNHVSHGELALDDEGNILAIRVKSYVGLGGHLSTAGAGISCRYFGKTITGSYDISTAYCNVVGTFTNTAPIDAYRGAGRPESMFLLERLIRTAADELDMDPATLRRRNLIPSDAFPYDNPLGLEYDSGDYERAMDLALDHADYESFRKRQREAREEGRYLGIGLCTFVELSGNGPSGRDRRSDMPTLMESGVVRVHPSGHVTAYCGTADHGQGHETTYAQILSERLGIPEENIEVVEGDTERIPQGTGTFASRSTAVGGSALAESAEKVVEQGRRLAAHKLEADPEDVEFTDGEFHVAGAPGRAMTFEEIAVAAHQGGDVPEGFEPGWEATTFYDPKNFTYPFGTHVATVEVNPDTGEIEILDYTAVDDCGEQINPMIVEGQIHGGVAQGLGQAFYEEGVYDDNGNLTTASLQDYAIPKAEHVPEMEVDHTVTPCPHNPLGVKGVGESGTIGAPPALVNAVIDALDPLDVEHIDMPLTPETVWSAIRDADEERVTRTTA